MPFGLLEKLEVILASQCVEFESMVLFTIFSANWFKSYSTAVSSGRRSIQTKLKVLNNTYITVDHKDYSF